MKAWSRFLGVASALALAGLAAAACDGPTIIIQNVVGDAGGVAPGDVDAGADAAEVPDADVDAGEAITACTPGTVTAKPTPLYLEVVAYALVNESIRRNLLTAINRMRFDDASFGLGLKPTADPDVDDAGLRVADRDGGPDAAAAYQQRLRDFPQVLSDARFVAFESMLLRAATAREAQVYGTSAQYQQLRAWNPSGDLRPSGRRAMLIIAMNASPDHSYEPSFGRVSPLEELAVERPVMTGILDIRSWPWVASEWGSITEQMTALGMHGDSQCPATALRENQRPAGTPRSFGQGVHALCVPTVYYAAGSSYLSEADTSAAIATVIGQLSACEYEVRGFDARLGGSLKMAIKAPDGSEQRIYALQDADAGRVSAPRGIPAQPPGFVLDDGVRPTKVTVTGEACLELRRDQARTLEITTSCP